VKYIQHTAREDLIRVETQSAKRKRNIKREDGETITGAVWHSHTQKLAYNFNYCNIWWPASLKTRWRASVTCFYFLVSRNDINQMILKLALYAQTIKSTSFFQASFPIRAVQKIRKVKGSGNSLVNAVTVVNKNTAVRSCQLRCIQ